MPLHWLRVPFLNSTIPLESSYNNMPINDDIQDNLIEAQLDTMRLTESSLRSVRALLESMTQEIRDSLSKNQYNPTEPSRITAKRARAKRFLDEVLTPRIDGTYDAMAALVSADMLDIASITVASTRFAVGVAIGVDVMSIGVPDAVLNTLVSNTLIPLGQQSATGREWWLRLAEKAKQRSYDEINKGIAYGENLQQITTRIRGTKARNYEDGVDALTKREADLVVSTYANGVLNEARKASFDANADVISSVTHVSTLDGRTTLVCISRDGNTYSLPGYLPIPPTTAPFLSGPPYHAKCRSAIVPVIRSFTELLQSDLGVRMDGQLKALPEPERASIDGQLPGGTTFDDFLRRKGEDFQVKLLGRVRRDLWSRGVLSLKDVLSAATGEPISVKELLAKYFL